MCFPIFYSHKDNTSTITFKTNLMAFMKSTTATSSELESFLWVPILVKHILGIYIRIFCKMLYIIKGKVEGNLNAYQIGYGLNKSQYIQTIRCTQNICGNTVAPSTLVVPYILSSFAARVPKLLSNHRQSSRTLFLGCKVLKPCVETVELQGWSSLDY